MNRFTHVETNVALIGASKPVRIAHELECEIRTGVFSCGDPLASENALVKRFSVSRNTVRKSLELLAKKGLITTKTGIGSFVTFGGRTIDDQAGWTLALSSSDTQLTTKILRLERGGMDLTGTEILPAAECLIVDRLRFSKTTSVGVSLERSRIPWRDVLQDVVQSGLIGGSLNATLRHHGLIIASGSEWAGVMPALPEPEAILMNRNVDDAMLQLRRITRSADGSIIEYVESLLDPDLFGLQMDF